MEETQPLKKKPDAAVMWLVSAITCLLVGTFVWLSTYVLGYGFDNYSIYLFIFVPLLLGIVGALVLSGFGSYSAGWSMMPGIYVSIAAALVMLVFGLEGLICVLMASPVIVFGVCIGGAMGYGIVSLFRDLRKPKVMASVLAALGLPALAVLDKELAPPPQTQSATTSVIIDARPEDIWPYLQNLPDIGPPDDALFKAGVAHPLAIRTVGSGVGAERHCELSTGDMPEVITKFDKNRLLEFKILKTPASMKELNPIREVQAAHLVGYFNCQLGRFELVPLKDGRTKLIGTSIYDHRFGPTWYWTIWTDRIVHATHYRVMNEVKKRAERDAVASRSAHP